MGLHTGEDDASGKGEGGGGGVPKDGEEEDGEEDEDASWRKRTKEAKEARLLAERRFRLYVFLWTPLLLLHGDPWLQYYVLFYLPAVLAGPVAQDTGWPLAWVVGGLTLGLLVAALASPHVGTVIERHGGRPVLALAPLLLAAGLVVLAVAPILPIYLAGWLVLGLGMGCGLYDPAFATLGRLYGAEARPAITTLTLWGGFASTVCWPLSGFLVAHVGWRGTCLAYAGLHLVVTLPLVLGLVPGVPERRAETGSAKSGRDPAPTRERLR